MKRFLYKLFFNICIFFGLSYGVIFFAKEIKKIEEEFNKAIK